MRRRGYTLIEVLAALAIVTAMMTVGLFLGSRFVTRHNEQAYFRRVQSEWRSLQTRAEVTPQPIAIDFNGGSREILLTSGTTPVQRLPLPKSLSLLSTSRLAQNPGKQFATPRVIYVHSRLGYEYRLAFEMGWGKLIVTRVDLGD
ncbi:prepilin-type N-terminal cleavage/methylation domain-containing protein [Lacticaseibacillus pabuli]|uniref:Prepilin-type N-terminal cleavage/methylation domain-containing protein n=1 Tax=Lacticaseibacillus pabuli TaxID=3025672 RepID=A0ABY7WSE3_9LACO|nr:prepilin-type N-terminal cleavage/methylation domain-containing protein [Lacticaseibacillus sp. KACC 23028]WDF81876.1 prepilin-type N-terminal cleavage/methylation domain-containing protein [Lacticaseibacillus sp. KACC 23028]